MLPLFIWCFYFVCVYGELIQIDLPEYTPPTQDVMMSKYFQKPNQNQTNRTKKSIVSVPEKLYDTIEVMKKELSANISNIQKELSEKNITDVDHKVNMSGPMQEYIRTGIFKNFLSGSVESTTYKYPTAIWSSLTYEKLKSGQKFRPRNFTRIYTVRPPVQPGFAHVERGNNIALLEKSNRRTRGKTKWKESIKSSEVLPTDFTGTNQEYLKRLKIERSDFVDRFLEQSLTKYLISSNLRENVGNVSVKTFSDILRNLTEQKSKRPQSPYDENKELRMKFREQVILKKKNETKAHGKFLEKQLQRRLEKVQDVFNEKDKDKIRANMWRYTALNRTVEGIDEKKNKTENPNDENFTSITTEEPLTGITINQAYNNSVVYVTSDTMVSSERSTTNPPSSPHYTDTQNPRYHTNSSSPVYSTYSPSLLYSTDTPSSVYSITSSSIYSESSNSTYSTSTTENVRGNIKYYNISRYSATGKSRGYNNRRSNDNYDGSHKNLLKLTAEESSYYRRGNFPSLTFIGQPEKLGVIPGVPREDYPVYSFPPATKFRCPKFKGGKPRMMADPETRCQVFYICTGDGPTTAMLCPNGTMFNENFLVCDWWYNVSC